MVPSSGKGQLKSLSHISEEHTPGDYCADKYYRNLNNVYLRHFPNFISGKGSRADLRDLMFLPNSTLLFLPPLCPQRVFYSKGKSWCLGQGCVCLFHKKQIVRSTYCSFVKVFCISDHKSAKNQSNYL